MRCFEEMGFEKPEDSADLIINRVTQQIARRREPGRAPFLRSSYKDAPDNVSGGGQPAHSQLVLHEVRVLWQVKLATPHRVAQLV